MTNNVNQQMTPKMHHYVCELNGIAPTFPNIQLRSSKQNERIEMFAVSCVILCYGFRAVVFNLWTMGPWRSADYV